MIFGRLALALVVALFAHVTSCAPKPEDTKYFRMCGLFQCLFLVVLQAAQLTPHARRRTRVSTLGLAAALGR